MDLSKKILIIDDDTRNIFALTAVLKAKGYTIISATSAKDGIVALSNSDVGIVLLDMMMPEMDGYETIQTIRQSEYKSIPIVAVTAQAMVGDREKCIQAGADGYLSKPVDVDELNKLLTQFLK